MNLDFSTFGVSDWAKLIGNVAIAFSAGYASGGILPGVVTAIAAFGALVQHAPGTVASPK